MTFSSAVILFFIMLAAVSPNIADPPNKADTETTVEE